MFDNELGCYVPAEWLENGMWFVDDESHLYIVPDGVAEIEGPDGPISDALNALCREHGGDLPRDSELCDLLALEHGLMYVPECLHRFDHISGYYHA